MLNRCEFIGNLGKDPEVKHLSNGDRVVNFSLAVSERWKDRNSGERKEKTTWVPVVIWNQGLGEVAERYLRKGSKIYVSGAFTVRKWTAQDGSDRYATEIVLGKFRGELVLLGDKGGEHAGGVDQDRQTSWGSPAPGAGIRPADGFDDEIPF